MQQTVGNWPGLVRGLFVIELSRKWLHGGQLRRFTIYKTRSGRGGVRAGG